MSRLAEQQLDSGSTGSASLQVKRKPWLRRFAVSPGPRAAGQSTGPE